MDIVSEVLLKLGQVSERLPGGLVRFGARVEEVKEILDGAGALAETTHHEEMRQRPGFGVEDAAFGFFVVIRRRVIHGEELLKRQQRRLPKEQDVSGAWKAKFGLLGEDFRIGVKLRQTFVKPERDVGLRLTH